MQNKEKSAITHRAAFIVIKRRQFLLYAIIGLTGVTIDYLAYLFGVSVLGLGILLANFISISLGILNNFILNTKYNFKKTDRLLIRFLLFYVVGFLGLILSEILILLFYNGLHTSAAVAKLLTLPFVLIVQYIINKHVSFGDINDMIRKFKRLSWHWPLYVLVIIFATSSLFLAMNIPTDYASKSLALRPSYAPDEAVHYSFNVQYIIKNKRLPVSGKDDLGAYMSCSPEHLAKVHCGYSYVVFPAASYVIDAVSAILLHKIVGAPYVMGARIPSVIFGLIFLISAYLSAFIITKRRLIATLITIVVGFIPEYIFTS